MFRQILKALFRSPRKERKLVIKALLDMESLTAPQVCDRVKKQTGETIQIGAMYVILPELEKAGVLSAWFGTERTQARNGARKRYYRIKDLEYARQIISDRD